MEPRPGKSGKNSNLKNCDFLCNVIRAAVGPIFMEHEKELEAARTDQVPRIRRFNFVVEDLKALYAPQAKKLDGSSYIQGKKLPKKG